MNFASSSIAWLDLHSGASSFLGAVVAVLFSATGFFIKSIFDKRKESREFLRRIEVGITTSLNQLLDAREQLKFLTKNLKRLTDRIESDKDEKSICIESVNFPAISEIYNNRESVWYLTKSYYLHNYILFSFKGIAATNAQIVDFRDALAQTERKNNRLVDLMMETGLNAKLQKKSYVENLSLVRVAIEKYILHMNKGIEILLQVKVYNDHLRRKFGWGFFWKVEGRSFKVFKDRKSYNSFSRNLDSCQRIDGVIKAEVDEEWKKLESQLTQGG